MQSEECEESGDGGESGERQATKAAEECGESRWPNCLPHRARSRRQLTLLLLGHLCPAIQSSTMKTLNFHLFLLVRLTGDCETPSIQEL
jgi:hypothetical protein